MVEPIAMLPQESDNHDGLDQVSLASPSRLPVPCTRSDDDGGTPLPPSVADTSHYSDWPPYLLPPRRFRRQKHLPSSVYCYRDSLGQPVVAVARFEPGTLDPTRKSIRPFRYEGGRFLPGLGMDDRGQRIHPPPFLLPELIARILREPDTVVYCVEGEKCALALHELGFCAVTLSGGSGAKSRWPEAAMLLAAHGVRRALILPDADSSGLGLADATHRAFADVGVLAKTLPPEVFGLEEESGEDVADWLERGGTASALQALKVAAFTEVSEVEVDTPEATPLVHQPEAFDALLFPENAMPPDLERYCRALAAEKGADPVLPFALAVAVLAGCLGQRVIGEPREGWKVATILWHVVVGPPGVKKSPILSALCEPLYRLNADRIQEWNRELDRWESERQRGKSRKEEPESEPLGPRPIPACVVVDDFTIESLVEILEASRAVLCASDELAGFFTGLGQYKKGGGNDRQQMLKVRSGKPLVVNRKSEGPRQISYPGLSLAGGIQPAVAMRLGGSARDREDGMCARFNWFHVRPLPPTLNAPPVPEYLRAYWESTIHRFHALSQRELTLDVDARAAWGEFYLDPAYSPVGCAPDEMGMIEKLGDTLFPIACVYAGLKHPDPKKIDGESMRMAIRYTKWVVEHNRRFLAMATGRTSGGADMERVLKLLQEAPERCLSRTALNRALRWDREPKRLPAAIEGLVRSGRVQELLRINSSGKGAPARVVQIVD